MRLSQSEANPEQERADASRAMCRTRARPRGRIYRVRRAASATRSEPPPHPTAPALSTFGQPQRDTTQPDAGMSAEPIQGENRPRVRFTFEDARRADVSELARMLRAMGLGG